MDFVRTVAQVSTADVPLAGGKGANLGELVRAGLPVPPGVVLTTDAYAAFVAAAGLDVPALAAQGAEAVQAAFRAAPVPDAVTASSTATPARSACWGTRPDERTTDEDREAR